MTLQTNRLRLFPDTTKIEDDTLTVSGQTVASLAERYGTPLYLLDRATLDGAAAHYRSCLQSHYPGPSLLTFAGKAFLCKAMAQWADQQRMWVDCTGEAEMAMAVAANLQPTSIVVHGVNKSTHDLQAAARHAGTIVVDNLSELRRLSNLLRQARSRDAAPAAPQLWLRLQPGIGVATHHPHTQTGQADSKFGMTPLEILQAAKQCKVEGLSLTGIHFHLGSNFRDTTPLVAAIEMAMGFAAQMDLGDLWHFSPGGGWGVAYHEDDLPEPDVDRYVQAIAQEIAKSCESQRLAQPILHLEPGRSLVARAGVAIYRVGAVKRRQHRTWLLTDGGMSDNPRHALYGAKYSCLPATGVGRERTELVSIAGALCESGDVFIEDLPMPRIEEGELLAIPVSGAYQLSMASNYNGACRPPVVWLEGTRSRVIIRRETPAELSQRHLSIT